MAQRPSRMAVIREMEGKLVLEVLKEWKAELVPVSDRMFDVRNVKPKATLEFVRDDKGKVTKFLAHQDGRYEWNRVE